jgi:hypothetical protein
MTMGPWRASGGSAALWAPEYRRGSAWQACRGVPKRGNTKSVLGGVQVACDFEF